jgi:lipopolysaccharide transport system permease protein
MTATGVPAIGAVTVTEIRPPSGWRSLGIGDLWRYRELIGFMAARDIKVRYKQTALGATWAVVQPLVTVLVFTLVFGGVAGLAAGQIPYPLLTMAALVPWTFFSTGVTRSSLGLLSASGMISKVYFPRLVLPVAGLAVSFVELLISATVLAGMMVWYHQPVGAGALMLIPLLIVALAASLGFGLIVSALTIRYRDLSHALPFLIQIGMYATPVVYPVALLEHKVESWGLPGWILGINPLCGVVAGFRDALFGTHDLTRSLLAFSAVVAFGSLVLGLLVFRRAESTVVDTI